MKIKSLIFLKIKALNQEKFFNKLTDNGIEVFNLKRSSQTTNFEIEAKNLSKVKSFAKQFGIEILKKKSINLAKLKELFFTRLGIFFALLLTIMLAVISNFFVFQISINGCKKLNKTEIVSYLESQNISFLTKKSAINSSKIELDLLEKFNQISMVSVSTKGLSLVINIKEKSEDLTEKKNFDVVSNFNGRIISLEVIAGESVVSKGDIVKNGQVLVRGITNDNGSQIQAKARIKAEVWVAETQNFAQKTIEMVKTGNKQTFREISIWGLTLFSNVNSCKYENFDKKIVEIKKQNAILPLKITNYSFEELEKREIIFDFEKNKEQLVNDCQQIALQKLEKNDIIKEEKYSVSTVGEITNLTYLITVERDILWS